MRNASQLLQNSTFVNGDFQRCLDLTERNDFVYLDPPYAIAKRRVFAEYHPATFATEDIKRLKKQLNTLDRRGVFFLVSYGDSREAREISDGWNSKRVRTKRNVAGFSAHRRHAYEILFSNLELQ
jgi:DNA adenine methylase